MIGAAIGGIFTLLGTVLAFMLARWAEHIKTMTQKRDDALLSFLEWWQGIRQERQPISAFDLTRDQSAQELRVYLFVHDNRINHCLDKALEARNLAYLGGLQNWDDIEYPAKRLWEQWTNLAAVYAEVELRNVTDVEELNRMQVAVDKADEQLAAMQKSVEGREISR